MVFGESLGRHFFPRVKPCHGTMLKFKKLSDDHTQKSLSADQIQRGRLVQFEVPGDMLVIKSVKVITSARSIFTRMSGRRKRERRPGHRSGKVERPFCSYWRRSESPESRVMKLFFIKSFVRDCQALPKLLQKTVDQKIELFLANPRHPSLLIKKLNGPRTIWEGRVTLKYCFTFQVEDILRRPGTHDMLRKP